MSNRIASLANLAVASDNACVARASSASVSSVMKFCATQPAWEPATPSFSSVALTLVRNALASSAVGPEDVSGPPGAMTLEQAAVAPRSRTRVPTRDRRDPMPVVNMTVL